MIEFSLNGTDWAPTAVDKVRLVKGSFLRSSGYLDLGSLTGIPEGVTLSAGGYLLRTGKTTFDSLTDIGAIEQEKAECRRVFKEINPPIGAWCMWLHHEVQFERLTEPWEKRFDYIAKYKTDNVAKRFRLMRPLTGDIDEAVRKVVRGKEGSFHA